MSILAHIFPRAAASAPSLTGERAPGAAAITGALLLRAAASGSNYSVMRNASVEAEALALSTTSKPGPA